MPTESREETWTSTAAILLRSQLPSDKNITKEENKALQNLKKDTSRVIMKADKGNCFVVLDREDYENKMESLLADRNTYELITSSPFRRIERNLDAMLLNLKRQQKLNDYFKLRSTDYTPPAIRGSIKHHKVGNPLRPIITCMSSPLYNTSKFLTSILAPIQNYNCHSFSNSLQFSKEATDIDIQDDEIMVSFDVVSLFTAIPVDKACNYIRKNLENDLSLHSTTSLDIDDIISLLNFVLSNNYFGYKDKTYKQIHGCAMGSPVSPVVAHICMEEIEDSAPVPPTYWKRYVDDSFCIIKKNAVSSFHDSLNSIDPHISLTIEHENNCQISFLDTLVSRDNGKLPINVYRKPTHTDRYLDFHSHHDNNHKVSTAATLRAINLPNNQKGREQQTKRVYRPHWILTATLQTSSPKLQRRSVSRHLSPHLKNLSGRFSNVLTRHLHEGSLPFRTSKASQNRQRGC